MNTEQAVRQAERSPAYGLMVRTGLAAYGVVHLAIAWVAGQLAWGKASEQASQQGALQELGQQPLGGVLLWVIAVGLFALTLWQVVEAVVGHRGESGGKRVLMRLKSAGKAAVYVVLGANAVAVAVGSGGGGGERTMTARLMSAPFGRVLVAIVGVAVLAVGVYHVIKAVTASFTDDLEGGVGSGTIALGRVLVAIVGVAVLAVGVYHVIKAVTASFTDDLEGGVGSATIALGRAGYASKGVALSLVGVLFGWAAITYDSSKAGGLDNALRRLRDQPAGPVLLTIVALGIACFGVYCFAWARKAKR